ncbi:hypothetical protein AK88_02183 [Plasmodium fragile]|nr:uncharacterized protein AK88_02183 [Plasmodium fragile]KJP88236.1 hypothetical protein AK88_02183 [Plasmodium fragile]
MIRHRRPGRLPAARRGPRAPRVNRRTIIELHLEVLNECEATEWEHVKDDYWQIVVQAFAQDLLRDDDTTNSILGVSTSHQALSGHNVSSTLDPPTDSAGTDPCPPNAHDSDPWRCMESIQLATDTSASNEDDPWNCMEHIQLATDPCPPHDPDPWSCMEHVQSATDPCAPHEHDPDPWRCMETIQLETGPCPPNDCASCSCMEHVQSATDPCPPNTDDPDAWSCMETIQLEQQETPSSPPSPYPGNEKRAPDHTNWINWIHRNKHILRACTTQPWFLQLTADWKQYLREHMSANAANAVSGRRDFGAAATMDSKKHAWKECVATQHDLMNTYSEEEWFQHLLNNVEEDTVTATGDIPGVGNDLEVDKVTAAANMLRVSDVPRRQLLQQPAHMTKPLTAQTWILILALVIEQCEVDSRLQQTELYVDDLLQQL